MLLMARRPDLGWAGAGVLIAVAVASLAQAATLGEATPVRAQPVTSTLIRTAGGPLRSRATGARLQAPVSAVDPGAAGPSAVVPPGRAMVRVPILMYHYIRVNPDPRDRLGLSLSVTPADFARQMDWLAANGYHPVDLADLRGYLLGHGSLPSRPVVLTFDDGYRDVYTTAFPVLRAHHFKAVAYIVSGFLNSPNNVTTEQVQEMDASGVQIGVHTVSHADLTKLGAGDLHREVFESKSSLEALLGHQVVDFCYPSGRFNANVVRMVESAGYETATTTDPGVAHSAADRFTWTRVRVGGGEPLERLIADLGEPEPAEEATGLAPAPAPAHPRVAPGGRLPVTYPLQPPPEALLAVVPG